MPFRLWCALAYVVAPLPGVVALLALALGGADLVDRAAARAVVRVAAYAFLALCVAGGVLALLALFGGLRMRCPLCGRPGAVGGDKARGLWLACPECGLVRGEGPLGLRFVRRRED
jgi:hypothetical protein